MKLEEAYQFFTRDLWHRSYDEKSPFYRLLRIFVLAAQGFQYDQCSVRASALTFYSLLAIVPVLALAFGIAQGFALDAVIEKELLSNFYQYKEVVEEVIAFARNLLAKTKGGVIAGLGVVVLVWTVINILSQIEDSFNHIWLVRQGRSWKRRFTDYLSAGWIIPILLIISTSALVMMIGEIEILTAKIPFIGTYSSFVKGLFDLLPLLATWALLTFLYLFMPNTTVHFKPALFAAFCSALIYHISHMAYVYFQFRISSYGAIYGSFVAFPLFLIWLQIGWMIILFGAELSYATQNSEVFALKSISGPLSMRDEKLLALAIMQQAVHRFSKKEKPLTLPEMGKYLGVPQLMIKPVMQLLTGAGLLSPVLLTDEEAYQPAVDISNLRITDVLKAIDETGELIPAAHSDKIRPLDKKISELHLAMESAKANSLLKDFE